MPPGGGGGGGGAFGMPPGGGGGGGGGGGLGIPLNGGGGGGGGGGGFSAPLVGGGAVPPLGPTLPRAGVSASAAAFSSRASRPASSSMARENASAAPPSSANETEDADANDVSEASDDASASVSDASVEISSKSATRASSSVGRLSAFVSPLGTETFSSAPLRVEVSLRVEASLRVEVSLRVTSGRLCFLFAFARSQRVEARGLSPSGPSPSSFFIGLGGSLPLVGAPSASAPSDDSTSPASLFETPGFHSEGSLSVLENGTKVSPRRLDESIAGDDGPDADLLVRRSNRRVGTVAESSSEEDAPFETRGGAVTTAIAVAVGVSGCASLWRARRSATSPLPPNRGVKGPRKREEGSSVSPLARASSSSSSLSEVSRRFPPSEGVAAPRARCQLGAIARLLCTTVRIGARSSARARRSAARRLNAPRKGGETTRAAIFHSKKRTTERGRRTTGRKTRTTASRRNLAASPHLSRLPG